jgi:hypothetical protein
MFWFWKRQKLCEALDQADAALESYVTSYGVGVFTS